MSILLCLLPIFIVSYFIFSKIFQPSKWKLLPNPSSFPIIGNLHHLSGLPHRCIHRLCIKYGPVMLLQLGFLPVVVISSSEAAEEVLKIHDLECSSRSKMVGTEKLSYGFKDITFGPYGQYWREMRKVTVIELFSLKKDIFLAGIDTGAITMVWTMTELVRNPRVMKKVQEYIRTTLGTGKKIITEEDLNKVDYLQLIIKETFRLHPPVPLVPRQTMSHVKIQGYDIPPKTSLQINVWTIGRDPKRWTDPEDFIPERFTDSAVDFRGHDFDLLPFGSGRRMCPGISMSIAAIELGLLNVLYFFDWRLPDGMETGDIDMEETGTLTVVKKLPLMLIPVQREL